MNNRILISILLILAYLSNYAICSDCATGLKQAIDFCYKIDLNQYNYYVYFYGCITQYFKDHTITDTCQIDYCQNTLKLDRFDIDCNKLDYDFSKASMRNVPTYYNEVCDVTAIAGCQDKLQTQQIIDSCYATYPSTNAEYATLYNCIKGLVADATCSACFCNVAKFSDFGVTC